MIKKLLIFLLLLQFLWAFLIIRSGVFPGAPVRIEGLNRQTLAVLTIDFNEPVKAFQQGKIYSLKALKIRGTKIDFGLVEQEIQK
jgi:hypothetical protein